MPVVPAEPAATSADFDAAFAVLEKSAQTTSLSAPVTLEWIASPVGPLLIACNEQALLSLEFTQRSRLQGQLLRMQRRYGQLTRGSTALTDSVRGQLVEYFAGQRRDFSLPLDASGTEFQQRVWTALQMIPYGVTWSYLDVALRLGDAGATRAVGMANGSNPVAIVIPCHRVINANGALGGYGGGLWRKQVLLDLELGQGRLGI